MSIKYNNIEKTINKLAEKNYTISFMESCSGGSLANAFTNIRGCSRVLKFSAVTYSDESKIQLGVNKNTIEKYTINSTQVSKEMAKCITKYGGANIGVGITGNMNLVTEENSNGGEIYISIYDKHTRHYTTKIIHIKSKDRQKGKEAIINFIVNDLMKHLEVI